MNSKYKKLLRESIDEFWVINHYPPTIRDLIELTGGTASLSHVNKILATYPDIRRSKHGRIIPIWVDELFEKDVMITR
jgi:hypothetical protein